MSWDQERGWYWRGRHCLGIKREGGTRGVGIVLGSRERVVLERNVLSWDQERGWYWRGKHCLGIKRDRGTGEVDIVLGSRERAVLER